MITASRLHHVRRHPGRGAARLATLLFAALAPLAAVFLVHVSSRTIPSRIKPPATTLGRPAQPIVPQPQPGCPPASRDHLAFVREDGIWVANDNGADQCLLIRNGEAPCWSRDRKQIGFAYGGNVWVADADGGNQRALTSHWRIDPPFLYHGGRQLAIGWDPHGDRLAYSHADQSEVWGTPGDRQVLSVKRESLFLLPGDESKPLVTNARQPAWSPSGRWIAFARSGGEVWDDIWVASPSGAAHCLAHGAKSSIGESAGDTYGMEVSHIAWSPDEKQLAFSVGCFHRGGVPGSIYLLQLAERGGSLTVRSRVCLQELDGDDPCFSPDGRWLAYWDQLNHGVAIVSRDGKSRHGFIPDAYEPAW